MSRFQAGALVVYGNLGVHEVEGIGLPTIVMQAIGSVMTFAVNGILLGGVLHSSGVLRHLL